MASTLVKKLGIKPGHRVALLDAEPDIPDLLTPWPDGATVVDAATAPIDVILFFVTTADSLADRFAALQSTLQAAGGFWIAWPKKASGRPTDLSFNVVQGIGLEAGLVDNKICAINAVWSGLRFVWRKADRPALPDILKG